MADQSVSYHDLPGVPEEAIIAITSNEPTPEDPLHVRHLKRIAARSVQVRIFGFYFSTFIVCVWNFEDTHI